MRSMLFLVVACAAHAGPPLTLSFEPDLGQGGGGGGYLTRSDHLGARILADGVTLGVPSCDPVSMTMVGANPAARLSAEESMPGRQSYVHGSRERWVLGVPRYRTVRAVQVYPGVDVVYYGSGSRIEYDLELDDVSRLGTIALSFSGIDDLCVDAQGDLVLHAGATEIRQRRPSAFCELDGRRVEIPVAYVLLDARTAELVTPARGREAPLVVDPVLEYASYAGGSEADSIDAIAVDAQGDVYVTGFTRSTDFPTKSAWQPSCATCPFGFSDAFVARIRGDFTDYVDSTYIGGSLSDYAQALAIDGNGDVAIAGATSSDDFPLANAFQSVRAGRTDAFLMKLDGATLTPFLSTYIGGSEDDEARGLSMAGSDPVVVGWTKSRDFPVHNALQPTFQGYDEGFVARIRSNGVIRYSTYLGTGQSNELNAVSVDASQSVFVAGASRPTSTLEAMVGKIDPSGTVLELWLALHDGRANAVTIDGAGDVYVGTGSSTASVTKLTPSGGLIWESVCPGGCYGGAVVGIGVDAAGTVFVAGSFGPEICPLPGIDDPASVAKIDPTGAVVGYSVGLGGSGSDVATCLAVDGSGDPWIGGSTTSDDFPTKLPLQSVFAGVSDGFVAKLGPTLPAPPAADFSWQKLASLPPATVEFANLTGCDLVAASWDFGDGGTSTELHPSHVYQGYGPYTVTLTADNAYGSDTEVKPDIIYFFAVSFVAAPTDGLVPLAVQFTNTSQGPVSNFLWDFGNGTTSTAGTPGHVYTAPGRYGVTLWATTPQGIASARGPIDAYEVKPDFVGAPRLGVAPLTVQFTDLTIGAPTRWAWSFGDGSTASVQNPSHVYTTQGLFTVSLTVTGSATTVTASEVGYVFATTLPTSTILVGTGPDPNAPPHVKGFDAMGQWHQQTSFYAYGSTGYGVNVAGAQVDGAAPGEILTGPGPSPVYGPHVRGFDAWSQPIPKISYYAYGTLRYGVLVEGANLDSDAYDEILTGAGPGAVFGPHVRGWGYDATAIAPLPGLSAFAYGTLRWGVNVGGGRIDGSSHDVVLTGPGPGPAFSPVVRAFAYGPPLSSIAKASFTAFNTTQYGCHVAAGNVDQDSFEEIVVGQGPGPGYRANVQGYDYDGVGISPVPGLSFLAFYGAAYGALAQCGDLNGVTGGQDEMLASHGPDPSADAAVQGDSYTGSYVYPLFYCGFTPFGTLYGASIGTGRLGY